MVGGGPKDLDGQREAATAAPAVLASPEIASPAASSAPRDVQCALTPSESEPCAGCARADEPVGDPEMDVDGQQEAATAAPAAEKESAHAKKESVHAVVKTRSVDPRFFSEPSLIGDLKSVKEQHDAVLAVTSNRLRRKWANRLTERIKWAADFHGVGHWPLKSVWDSVLMLLVELKPARKLGTCCVGQVLRLNHVQRDVLAVEEGDRAYCRDGWVLLSPAF